jgi:hypothetical protein
LYGTTSRAQVQTPASRRAAGERDRDSTPGCPPSVTCRQHTEPLVRGDDSLRLQIIGGRSAAGDLAAVRAAAADLPGLPPARGRPRDLPAATRLGVGALRARFGQMARRAAARDGAPRVCARPSLRPPAWRLAGPGPTGGGRRSPWRARSSPSPGRTARRGLTPRSRCARNHHLGAPTPSQGTKGAGFRRERERRGS